MIPLYQANDKKLCKSSSSELGGLSPIEPSNVDLKVFDASTIDKKFVLTLVVKLLL
jgi:hypothetical protein